MMLAGTTAENDDLYICLAGRLSPFALSLKPSTAETATTRQLPGTVTVSHRFAYGEAIKQDLGTSQVTDHCCVECMPRRKRSECFLPQHKSRIEFFEPARASKIARNGVKGLKRWNSLHRLHATAVDTPTETQGSRSRACRYTAPQCISRRSQHRSYPWETLIHRAARAGDHGGLRTNSCITMQTFCGSVQLLLLSCRTTA